MSELAVKKAPIDIFPCPISLKEEDKDCVICLDQNDQTSLTHGSAHRWHKNCILEWMTRDKTCPNCRDPIKYSFESKTEKVNYLTTNFIRNFLSGSTTGLKYVHNYHLFATITAAAAVSLYAGMWTDKILTCLGMGSALAATWGIACRLIKSDGAATEATKHAYFLGTSGSMVAAIAFISDKMHETIPLLPFQVLGAFTILHNGGRTACANLVDSIANAILPASWYSRLKSASMDLSQRISGYSGTSVNPKFSIPVIGIALASGYTVATTTAKHFVGVNPLAGRLIGAVLGVLYAAATAEVVHKGYDSYEKNGYCLV